jgi:class 3 adenylate cyclase
MTESRKIAAILAADVVGYSRLTGADEERTLARVRALRSDLIDPTMRGSRSNIFVSGFISAGGEVVSALGGHKDAGAGFERRNQSGDGALSDLAQIGLELGERLLDRVQVGAVWRKVAQFRAGGRMSSPTRPPLWLDRLSMTTMSPGDRIGTRQCSTQSSTTRF